VENIVNSRAVKMWNDGINDAGIRNKESTNVSNCCLVVLSHYVRLEVA
jgi:hypothetical protein